MDNEMEQKNMTAGAPAEEPVEIAPADTEEKPSDNGPIGPAIGTIIIVIILIIGGLYLWGAKLSKESAVLEEKAPEEILAAPDETFDSLETQGTSDEVSAIEGDLQTTDLDNLDAELQDIEAELGI